MLLSLSQRLRVTRVEMIHRSGMVGRGTLGPCRKRSLICRRIQEEDGHCYRKDRHGTYCSYRLYAPSEPIKPTGNPVDSGSFSADAYHLHKYTIPHSRTHQACRPARILVVPRIHISSLSLAVGAIPLYIIGRRSPWRAFFRRSCLDRLFVIVIGNLNGRGRSIQ